MASAIENTCRVWATLLSCKLTSVNNSIIIASLRVLLALNSAPISDVISEASIRNGMIPGSARYVQLKFPL